MSLKNKVAVITGASRGIGRGIAEVFAENGANVVINYKNSFAEANDLVEKIRKNTDTNPIAVQADISKQEDVEKLFNTVVETFGRVDILVNNAGITVRGATKDIDEATWDLVMGVNLKAPFLCAKAVIPAMLENEGGSIINIASIRGVTGSGTSIHYAVSKAGLLTLTKSLAMEFAPHIRVNAVIPGYTATDLHAHLKAEDIQKIEEKIPLKRFGQPDDIAQAALFLASEHASYITGDAITVSGGLVMR